MIEAYTPGIAMQARCDLLRRAGQKMMGQHVMAR